MLFNFTFVINLISLVVATWLGLYLVTRNPRSKITWLTALSTWMIAGLFLNILFAMNPPLLPVERPFFLRLLLVFWGGPVTESGAETWLLGWSITIGIVAWHHATTLMRGQINRWRQIRIWFGYLVAATAIYVRLYTPLLYSSETGDPLYLNSLVGGPLYLPFGAGILFFTGWSFINLIRSARAAASTILTKQLETLAMATLIGSLAGPLSIAGSALGLQIPIVYVSISLGISIFIIGYGVARYSAIVEGRTVHRDFLYSAVSLITLVLAYLLATWLLLDIYQLPPAVYVLIALFATVTQSLHGFAEQILDRLIYQKETSNLRTSLRQLGHLAIEQEQHEEKFSAALSNMSAAVRATYALLMLQEKDTLRLLASYDWHHGKPDLTPDTIAADDVIHLDPAHFPAPLEEAALLIPLYADTEQIGAILLGRPSNGLRYAKQNVEDLLDSSDRIANAIRRASVANEQLKQINELAQARQTETNFTPEKIAVAKVEKALRNIKDYAFLGDSSLSRLRLVRARLTAESVTHVDRGKILFDVLSDALNKLRPDGKEPVDMAPREWHAFLVLHDAYIKERLNREIMSRLYISEGTFNRTRRAALRAVTRIIEEMESATP